MHTCPECGQACTCNGDIECHDNELESEFCSHECDEYAEDGMGWEGDESD